MEVEQLQMELEVSQPSSNTTNSHTYMDGNTQFFDGGTSERFEHEDEYDLQVFEISTLMEDVIQAFNLLHKDHELLLRVVYFDLSEVADYISHG